MIIIIFFQNKFNIDLNTFTYIVRKNNIIVYLKYFN